MSVKNELQNIISGNGSVRCGAIIQTIKNDLRGKKKAISQAKETEFCKEQEAKILKEVVFTPN